jgi:hypothetical protein
MLSKVLKIKKISKKNLSFLSILKMLNKGLALIFKINPLIQVVFIS